MYSYDRTADAQKIQLKELVDQAATMARALHAPRVSGSDLAKKVVQSLLRRDTDGSMLGAVYNDMFDRMQFLRSLTNKLRGLDVNYPQIAESILLELEDQR